MNSYQQSLIDKHGKFTNRQLIDKYCWTAFVLLLGFITLCDYEKLLLPVFSPWVYFITILYISGLWGGLGGLGFVRILLALGRFVQGDDPKVKYRLGFDGLLQKGFIASNKTHFIIDLAANCFLVVMLITNSCQFLAVFLIVGWGLHYRLRTAIKKSALAYISTLEDAVEEDEDIDELMDKLCNPNGK